MNATDMKLLADAKNQLPNQQEYSLLIQNIRITAQGGQYTFLYNGVLSGYTLGLLTSTGFVYVVGTDIGGNPIVTVSWS